MNNVKNEIIDMVNQIENVDMLNFLYVIVKDTFNDSLIQQDLQCSPVVQA